MADPLERLSTALADRYRIERELGSGGMATVYLAEDLRHPRRVAIKVLKPELAAVLGRERFRQEIALAASLQHPYIVSLHDSGAADEIVYYVMPYLGGESLRQRLERENQLPLEDALRIGREVAEALDYAHRRGVVHRDIKPENILFQGGHAMVADFGIARAVDLAGGTRLTDTGVMLGTPTYMSPEQALGAGELDGRSDQYSLACVVYEMLAGQPPLPAASAQSAVHQHLNVLPRPVTDLRPSVPAAVVVAITLALAKTPADRFASIREFARALESATPPTPAPPQPAPVAPGPGAQGSETAPTLPIPRRVRRRMVVAAVAVVVAAVALLVWWWTNFHGRPAIRDVTKKDWILVADFEGPSQDPGLATATREFIGAALDQSEIVTTVPRSQIKLALESAGKPDSTRVTAEVAQELAYRTTVRTVLEGRLEPLARGYAIVLRGLDVERRQPLFVVTGTARDERDLIPTLQKLAVRLRKRLGENLTALEATRSMRQSMVVTPSFDAYRKYAQAYELQQIQGDDRGSLVLIREALELDPDFAAAWQLKYFAFSHLGLRDSMPVSLDEALRRPHRLTDEMRLECQALSAGWHQDYAAADATYRELERRGYDLASTFGDHAGILASVGRFDEALEYYNRAMQIGPFGTQQWILGGRLELLLRFRMLEDARAVVARMKGWGAERGTLALAVTAGDWAGLDSLSRSFAFDPLATPEVRALALRALSSSDAARGAVATSMNGLRRWAAVGENRQGAQLAMRSVLLLAVAADVPPGQPPASVRSDTSFAGVQTRATWAVASGDLETAAMLQRVLELRGSRGNPTDAAWEELIPAWIEGKRGRWDRTVEALADFSGSPEKVRAIGNPPLVLGRWILADAWEHLSQPDSAAAVLELTLSQERLPWAYRITTRMVSPFLHRRLVLLYCHMGRLEDAHPARSILASTYR
ncbi:MAG: hypothetical protein E6K81_14225 [Candidatus Eisenbacteria bacterium]|uniref:non-specific serine/threonine protein kinase n=1 Tax=Eiseniibacteriota bacterium TaxID=2212470 RepID=A0A538U1R8_UNCEI|nr:MAG: hypothetical protein E6K81_14225 [Candidatus Eisenbacteria bacterium]